MRIVDAHLHVWDLDRAVYPWLGPHLATQAWFIARPRG